MAPLTIIQPQTPLKYQKFRFSFHLFAGFLIDGGDRGTHYYGSYSTPLGGQSPPSKLHINLNF